MWYNYNEGKFSHAKNSQYSIEFTEDINERIEHEIEKFINENIDDIIAVDIIYKKPLLSISPYCIEIETNNGRYTYYAINHFSHKFKNKILKNKNFCFIKLRRRKTRAMEGREININLLYKNIKINREYAKNSLIWGVYFEFSRSTAQYCLDYSELLNIKKSNKEYRLTLLNVLNKILKIIKVQATYYLRPMSPFQNFIFKKYRNFFKKQYEKVYKLCSDEEKLLFEVNDD